MEKKLKKVMMVDDDQVILKIGKHILKETYEVFPLPSAAKMFELLEVVTPDVILLDVFMPDENGIQAIKRLKADSRFARIPVIFVTSIDDDRSVYEHLKLGAYSHIAKPFSAEDLLTRLENCLNDYMPDEAPVIEEEEEAKPVIIAVDDAPDILRMVHLLLRDIYKVYILSEPEKLETLLHTVKPDLFLLDYKMPDVSGFDLIPVIRSFPEHNETPIIFLTSVITADSLTVASRLGASDYIVKPINAETLREKVAKHIKK